MSAPPPSHAPRGLAAAFFGAAMGACFLIAWKESVRFGAPSLALLVMLASAATFNSLTALVEVLRTPRDRAAMPLRQLLLLSAGLSVFTLLGNWSSAEAVQRISGALLAVVQRCEVIVVALLGALVLGERVRTPFWIGTLIAGVGLFVLQRPDLDARSFDPVGALYGLGAALCFGAIIVASRRFIRRVQPFLMNALRLWISVALWFAVERRVPARRELPAELLIHAGLAGFFGPFLSRLGALLSSRDIPASLTALASLATPVITALLAFALFGQIPSERELVGGSIMLLGVSVPVVAMLRARRPA